MRIPAAACCLAILAAACSAGRGPTRTANGAMSERSAVQQLHQQGYTQLTSLHQRGTHWIGVANKSGARVQFDMDKDGSVVDFIVSKSTR